jgi:hypothetical protein
LHLNSSGNMKIVQKIKASQNNLPPQWWIWAGHRVRNESWSLRLPGDNQFDASVHWPQHPPRFEYKNDPMT